MGEGGQLLVVGLDEGVGHGARQGDAPAHPRPHVRGPVEAGDVAGPRREQGGLGAVGAAHAEVRQHLVPGGQPHPGRLRGDQGLELQQIDETGLHQLGLAQGRHDPQEGLVGKEDRALGQGVDLAGEAQVGEGIDERLVKAPAVGEPLQLIGGKAQAFEIVEGLFQTRRHQEIAAGRQLAHKELEDRRVRHALVEIGLEHGELIEIGEQSALVRTGHLQSPKATAPAARMVAMARAPSPGWTSTARTPAVSSRTS